MADNRSKESRSALMSRVPSEDTALELFVRHLLHSMGYRYRIHNRVLPGKPDIVFHGRKKAIFVHGCFWHAHGCRIGRPPKSNVDFWGPKLARNTQRDQRVRHLMEDLGWQVLIVWQCEIKDPASLSDKLRIFLGETRFPRPTKLSVPGSLH